MNKIRLSGTATTPELSHDYMGERFYKFYILVARRSGTIDTLPCIIPELYVSQIAEQIEVTGGIRTRNVMGEDEKSHLEIIVFVNSVSEYPGYDGNEFEADATICKQPIYRKTPLEREVADVLLATNRNHGRSDYIPSLFWGRSAVRVSDMQIGERVKVYGRLQSREYLKNGETRVAYELSTSGFKEINDEE